jgi:hypothetical protein
MSELDHGKRVVCVASEVAVVCVGDHVAWQAMPIEPARKRKDAALGAAKLLDLSDDDRARIGGWSSVRHQSALG